MTPGKLRSTAAVLAIALVVLAGYFVVTMRPVTNPAKWPDRYASIGEQLYFTGRGAGDDPMLSQGGNHHRTMMGGGGCVSCHGTDREGGRLFPTFWQVAPPLTAHALVGDHGQDGHEHASYTGETLAAAITDGMRPDGSAIGAGMPRWSMSKENLDALVEYLLAH